MGEALQKMDEVFATERKAEVISAGEALGLIGAAIRKAATAEESPDFVKAVMQRAYLLTQQVESSLGMNEESEDVRVTPELLSLIRKDAEFTDVQVLPISQAMEIVKSRLSPEGTKTEDSTVAKSREDPVWGPDLNAGDDAEAPVNWGSDPDWSKAPVA